MLQTLYRPINITTTQPNPQQELQQQMQMKAMELQERQTAIGEQKVQIDAEEKADKQALAEQKAEFDVALKVRPTGFERKTTRP